MSVRAATQAGGSAGRGRWFRRIGTVGVALAAGSIAAVLWWCSQGVPVRIANEPGDGSGEVAMALDAFQRDGLATWPTLTEAQRTAALDVLATAVQGPIDLPDNTSKATLAVVLSRGLELQLARDGAEPTWHGCGALRWHLLDLRDAAATCRQAAGRTSRWRRWGSAFMPSGPESVPLRWGAIATWPHTLSCLFRYRANPYSADALRLLLVDQFDHTGGDVDDRLLDELAMLDYLAVAQLESDLAAKRGVRYPGFDFDADLSRLARP